MNLTVVFVYTTVYSITGDIKVASSIFKYQRPHGDESNISIIDLRITLAMLLYLKMHPHQLRQLSKAPCHVDLGVQANYNPIRTFIQTM